MLDRTPRPPRIVRRMFAAYFAVLAGAGISSAMRTAPDWAHIVALVALSLVLGSAAELVAILLERGRSEIPEMRGRALDRCLANLGLARQRGESDRSARARAIAAMRSHVVTRTAVPWYRDER
jgi:hypothetical protein